MSIADISQKKSIRILGLHKTTDIQSNTTEYDTVRQKMHRKLTDKAYHTEI